MSYYKLEQSRTTFLIEINNATKSPRQDYNIRRFSCQSVYLSTATII